MAKLKYIHFDVKENKSSGFTGNKKSEFHAEILNFFIKSNAIISIVEVAREHFNVDDSYKAIYEWCDENDIKLYIIYTENRKFLNVVLDDALQNIMNHLD